MYVMVSLNMSNDLEKYVGKYVIVKPNWYLCPTGRMKCTEIYKHALLVDDGYGDAYNWVVLVEDVTIDTDQSDHY